MNGLKPAAAIAVAIMMMTGAAHAADVYMPPPPPLLEPLPPMELRGGFYLRGYVGVSNQRFDKLDYFRFATTPGLEFIDKGHFDSGGIYGGGLGYRFNDWLRMDVTGELRGKTHFAALDRYPAGPGYAAGTNDYSAKKSEWLFLMNAYVDLGTWKGITPYVGAGIGGSRVTISGFRDVNVPNGGVAFASDASKWNLAWAAHAGLAFQATDNLTIDLGYRYVHLGDGRTGPLTTFTGLTANQPMHFKGIYSHDVHLGLRWNFGHEDKGYYYDPPVIAKN